jgi:Transposase DDE domain
MIQPYANRLNAITLDGDKGFDVADFVRDLREIDATPHITQNTTRRSAIDCRTTRHYGYEISKPIRKRVEEGFGWMKTIGGVGRMKYRGREKLAWTFTLAAAVYNLIRLPKLMAATARQRADHPGRPTLSPAKTGAENSPSA